jgi:hypothetical protein
MATGLTTRRLVIAMLFMLLFAMAVRIPVDTDTWWHLRSGEYILNTRTVPTTDPFSFTRGGQPWIDHSWGSQIVLYGFYSLLGGNTGLALYTALLATIGMALIYPICAGNAYVRAFVIVLAAAAAAVFWSARPQMMSFALSAYTLYVIYSYKTNKRDLTWTLPILMIVWVNLHSGWFIAFILIAGTLVGEVLGRIFDRANPDVLSWQKIGRLALFSVIAYAVLILNPNGAQMYTYPFRTFGIGVLQQFIQEWASPDFHGRETWGFVILMLGTFAAAGYSNKRLDLTDAVLFSGTAFMSLYAGRNISTFALVAAPILCRHLNAILTERGLVLRRERPAKGMFAVINLVILVLVAFGSFVKIAATVHPRAVAEAHEQFLPVKVSAFLRENDLPRQMFNSYNWGGYLLYAAPDYPVFVDGRTDLYDDELLRQWLETTQGQNWQDTFTQWNIQTVVIETGSPLARILRERTDWNEVYTDDMASVFTSNAQ